MRRLVLSPRDTLLFQALWEGWSATTLQVQGLQNLKTALDVHGALEVISKEAPGGQRVLSPEGGELRLDESRWSFLKEACERVGWKPSAAAQAVTLLEWLANAEVVS